jgi:hypothetical protein
VELQRRAKELDRRRRSIAEQHQTLTEQRDALAKDNRLRQRIGAFAERAIAALDGLDFDQRQQLLRTVVEEVRVTGWKVDIRLRIPLDEGPGHGPPDNDSPVVPTNRRQRQPRPSVKQ